MLTPEAIKELRQSKEMEHANELITKKDIDGVVLPNGFTLHHLEQYREGRERLTGTMKTPSIESFKEYAAKFSLSANAMVFVEPEEMTACCALNFGSQESPGHADHLAKLILEQTAEYRALLKLTNSGRTSQKAAAEWCEDYIHCCEFLDGDQTTTIVGSTAIKALRNLKVDAKATATSGVGSFNREKSLLESTSVDTSEGLPHFIRFTCIPYKDLSERPFVIRVGVGQDGNGGTAFAMQIVRHDVEVQDMAQELADRLEVEMESVSVFLGNWSKKG